MKKTKYGWIGINGIYYVYDRKRHCVPSCGEKIYFETTNKAKILAHLIEIN